MQKYFDTKDLTANPSFTPENHTGVINYRIVDHDLGSRHVAVWQGILDPEAGADAHVHSDMEQIFYVQEGEILLRIDDEEQIVRTEGLVFVPAGMDHQITAQGSKQARVLVFTAPAPPKNRAWDEKK
jgi:quercetin dioxygenase-like cupin family protein